MRFKSVMIALTLFLHEKSGYLDIVIGTYRNCGSYKHSFSHVHPVTAD
jgi:hypothetical protein